MVNSMMKLHTTDTSLHNQYHQRGRKKIALILGSALAVLFLSIYFLTLGVTNTDIGQAVKAICQGVSGTLFQQSDPQSAERKIIFLIRLPRIVIALFSGIGLSVAGTAMQAITRNPMVSPFTIGISSASAFGASIAIVFGVTILPKSDMGIVLNAFLCSLLCALLIYGVSRKNNMRPESIVLTGIALNYIFSAMTSAIEFFAAEYKLAETVSWTFGTFNGAVWEDTILVIIFVSICTLVILRFSMMLNTVSAGDDELVKSLGINPTVLRIAVGAASVLMTSSIISFTGVIGFVGLVAPHIARMIMGNDHRYLIPFSAVTGAALMIIADTIGRLLLSPVTIPVGIVVSFVGVPLFIHLIINKKEYGT